MLNIKNNLIVLSTSRAIRDTVNDLKSSNQFLSKYITIGDLFDRVVLCKDNKKFIDKNLKVLYLVEAINNCDISKLGFSSDFSTFLKQSDYIFKFFLETATGYVSFDELLSYDTYTLYSDHIEILKTIYQNYIEILDKNGFTDNILLPNSYKINNSYLEQFDSITINLEGYLSSFEKNIINDIANVLQTTINISFNQFNTKNFNIFNIANPKEILEIGYNYSIDITNNIVLSKEKSINNNVSIEISPIDSKLEQIAFIKYQITLMYKNGIEADNIAVIVPDEKISSYIKLFETQDEKYFNFAMGNSISNHKIIEVLRLISKMVVDTEPKDIEKFKFLKISQEIYDNIFVKNWNSNCTKDIFETMIEYIYSFEDGKNNEEIKEKLQAVKIKLEILLYSSNAIFTLKLKEVLKILINEIVTITTDDVAGGKITVLGILETRAVEFDAIIIVDFNDSKIPKISVKDKFISSNIKALAELPTKDDRENLQRYYYKRILDKAKYIGIGYIADDANTMSRFIVQLFQNYKQYIKRLDFKNILYSPKTLSYQEQDIVLDIDLSQKSWSATSLSRYLKCKRAYYLSYIKNIKDHTISLKPLGFEVGNILHNALEDAVKQNNFNDVFIDNYITKYQKMNPYLVLELEIWKKRLKDFFEFEKVREQNGISIYKVEVPFELAYKGITIKGKIDRIDKHLNGSFEILDYKTSKSLKIDTEKSYQDSTDFQLEFYYLSQRDKNISDVSYYTLYDSAIKPEVMLKEKIELLEQHFTALKTSTVNFCKTEDMKNCTFCEFKTICNR